MLISKRFFSNYFSSGSFSIIGPKKKKGEDAFYTGSDILAIADGVGGWTLQGVDPSKYAWELMRNVEKYSNYLLEPDRTSKSILTKAAFDCKEIGSSTCSLILLNKSSSILDAINIGDSGFYIYRKVENELKLIDKSKEVLHGFNFPYQLGTGGDKTDTAWSKSIEVKDKDFIVMYTDGLCDNLWEENVREMLKEKIGEKNDLNAFAKMLAEKAFEKSTDESYLSPFAKAAVQAYRESYTGGKPDDITVIVAQVNISTSNKT